MLNIENLSLTHKDHLILNHVNLTIQKGDILGLMGPSGSGKSSLLRCIQEFEKYEGKITLKGRACMIFQDFQLFPHMKVIDNITYVLQHVEKKQKKEARKEAIDLLKLLGLESKADAMPGSLSGGQKQRIAILRAIASKADILLLDEPTSALDSEAIADLSTLFKSLNDMGPTLLIVSHDHGFLKQICQKIYKVENGQLKIS